MKKTTKILGAGLLAAAAGNAVHAALYKPEKRELAPLPEEAFNVERPSLTVKPKELTGRNSKNSTSSSTRPILSSPKSLKRKLFPLQTSYTAGRVRELTLSLSPFSLTRTLFPFQPALSRTGYTVHLRVLTTVNSSGVAAQSI